MRSSPLPITSVRRRVPAVFPFWRGLAAGCLALSAVLCAAQTTAAQSKIVPTTTLAIQTGNNTSAANSFTAQNNGNAGASNVSKVSVRSLLYSGSTTQIYAHLLPWFGQSSHMNVGYSSNDPTEIAAQVSDMMSRGVQGVVVDWYGASSTFDNQTALNVMAQAETENGAFQFAIQEDSGALSAAASSSGCNVTQQLISDLTYVADTFEGSSAYMRIDGRPVVFFFGVTTYYIDWDAVRAAVPLNPIFISENQSAFTLTQSNGAFSWVSVDRTNPYDQSLTYLDDFYGAALAAPTEYAIGSAYKGFNDSLASWGTNRFMHQQCGQTWLASIAELGKYYSSSDQLYGVQLATWNDYEEGTEMESGIDNCLTVLPTVSGQTVSWTIPPDPAAVQALGASQVNENTVDHYVVYISTDGQNLMALPNVAAGTHSLDLSTYGFAAGNYTLYVQAVGKPCILNKMSPAVSYNPAIQPPVANLSVTPASGAAPLSVTASTAASTDSDGSIVSSQINFGDGTVMSGPTATHSYARPGPYNVLATVTDSNGLAAVTASTVTVAALAQPGVAVTSPTNASNGSTSIQVTADAVTQQPLSLFSISVDGQITYQIAETHINTALKLFVGPHVLLFTATDTAQNTVSSTVNITVQGTVSTPVAVLGLSTVADQPPDSVLACTANSTGYISSYSIDFGDGTVLKQVAALHTYANSQPYVVTATITDVYGVTSIATETADSAGPDFGFAASPTIATLNAGTQSIVNLSIAPNNGSFTGAVSFACSGLPAGASCSFSPSSVTPGNATVQSTLTISTASSSAAKRLQARGPGKLLPLYALWLGLPGLVLATVNKKIARKRISWLLGCVILSLTALLVACGGGSSSSSSGGGTQSEGAPPATYTVTMTATSGSVQHSIPFTLTIE